MSPLAGASPRGNVSAKKDFAHQSCSDGSWDSITLYVLGVGIPRQNATIHGAIDMDKSFSGWQR